VTRRRFTAALLAGVALAGGARGAAGHAFLVRSSPAARSTLGQAPARVELWFNERLEPAYSTVSVWDASGKQVDRRDATVGPDDRKRLSVAIAPLPAGQYTVRYRVLSVDGHVVDSSLVFTIGTRRAR
jgi:methionine-rich copper-binding protein CopC